MNNTQYKTTPSVKRILPFYRKRTFSIKPTGVGSTHNTASYWSDGSKDSYTIWNYKTGQKFSPPCGSYPTFQAQYALKPNEVLISCGVFRGKPGWAFFYVQENELEEVKKFLGVI